ncbi:unannotated protein [freshwater metagenome]|uniref:Unannotated protein n=1 Tax=freshwater metagenome TaxID=449393 RepID=A0A6J6BSU8_9ZZZZ|nr:phosphatase PAP2 family protein [Actinomycetota bacterium]
MLKVARVAAAGTVLALLFSACSTTGSADKDPSKPATTDSAIDSATPQAAEVKAAGQQPAEPLGVFAPVGERWSYLPAAVATPSVTPNPDAEAPALRQLRDELATRPPASGADGYTRVSEATPTRFMDLLIDVGRRRSLNPLRMSRFAAVMGVAAHEAVVAAARSSVAPAKTPAQFDKALATSIPGTDGWGVELPATSLPPEIVAAAAMQTVACSSLPIECPRFEQLGQVARDRLIASGAVWPSQIDAGWNLGVTVGQETLAYANQDGAAPWTGDSAAAQDGSWVPTPGMFAPALEPNAGSWRPWNLSSGSQFRPPAPPQPGSAEFRAAAEQVLAVGSNLSDRALRIVRFWDMGPGTSTPPGYWLTDVADEALRTTAVADQASALAVLSTALFDASVAIWDSKYTYDLVRPVTVIRKDLSPQWLPTLLTPPFPAYVSGHAGYSTAAAVVLAQLIPKRGEEFYDSAAEATDSRVRGGIHYFFDATGGVTLGESVAATSLQRAGLAPSEKLKTVGERLEFQSADVGTQARS